MCPLCLDLNLNSEHFTFLKCAFQVRIWTPIKIRLLCLFTNMLPQDARQTLPSKRLQGPRTLVTDNHDDDFDEFHQSLHCGGICHHLILCISMFWVLLLGSRVNNGNKDLQQLEPCFSDWVSFLKHIQLGVLLLAHE